MKYLLILALLLPTAAFAQQQVTPSQLAINIDGAVNGMAQALESANAKIAADAAKLESQTKTIADLQKQITDLKGAAP